MNFVSYSFVALFLIVFACRLAFGRRKVERPYVGVLLVSSLVFYGWHVPGYLLILLASAVIGPATSTNRQAFSLALAAVIIHASVPLAAAHDGEQAAREVRFGQKVHAFRELQLGRELSSTACTG